MTTGADVRDILELTGGENDGPISKKDLINSDKVSVPVSIFTCYSCNVTHVKSTHGEWILNHKNKPFPEFKNVKACILSCCWTALQKYVFKWNYTFLLQKKSKKSTETLTFKRPEGMHREVYALLYSDKKYEFLILND